MPWTFSCFTEKFKNNLNFLLFFPFRQNIDLGSLIRNMQCGNSRTFLPLRFYVESILVCRNSETAILSKKIFCKSISRMLKFVKFKIQRLSNGKYDTFWNRRSTEIDFMWNILVSYTTLNALVGAGRSWVRILLKGWNFFFFIFMLTCNS